MAGFLIEATREPVNPSPFDVAGALHHACRLSVNMPVVDVRLDRCRIRCMTTQKHAYCLWTERGHPERPGSFVYILGWCYRIDAEHDVLTDQDCRQMLERHARGLPPVGEEYGGQYVAVVYHSGIWSIAIQPDRYALSSVYVACSSQHVVVSNRATAVASLVHAAFDGYSVLSWMRGTHLPFDRSLFSEVSRVMPGDYLVIDVNVPRLVHRKAAPIYPPLWHESQHDAVDLLCERIARVARRVAGGQRILCDLTGGNDTRLTAAAVAHNSGNGFAAPLTWCVVGAEEHPDVQIATRIAKMYQWRLLRFERLVPTEASLEALREAAVYGDGSILIDYASCRVRRECSYRGQYDWHVGSIGGELLRGFFWDQELWSLGRTSTVNYQRLLAFRLYASLTPDLRVFGPDLPSLAQHEDVLLEPYRLIDREGGDLLNPYKLDAMYLRKTADGSSWLTGLQDIRCPLLSWEITSLALALPWQWKTQRKMTLRLLTELAPLLARIPTDTGAPMAPWSLTHWPAHTAYEVTRRVQALPRLLRRLTGGSGGKVAHVMPPPPVSWRDQLTGPASLDAFVDRTQLSDLLRRLESPTRTADHLHAFYTLLTLELLLQGVPNLRAQLEFRSD